MLRKKTVHPKGDPTSNCNNSETVCLIYLKINERTVHNSDPGHTKVVLTNGSWVILVRSWVTFWVDWFFEQHPLVREQKQFYKLQGNKFTFKLFKKLSHFKWLVFSTNIKHFSTCQNGQTIKICHSVSSEAAEPKKYLVYVLFLLTLEFVICLIFNYNVTVNNCT